MKKVGTILLATALFSSTFLLYAENDEEGTWSAKPTLVLTGGSEDERTERTYTFALIAPNQTSIDMRFNGGQRVDGTAKNNGMFGATLNWKRHIVSDQTIFAGILLPSNSTSMEDGILAEEPYYYKYSASTASSVSNISFVYKTKY